MRDILDSLTIALQVIGSGLIALLGGLDNQLTALMVLVIVNTVTGLAAMRVQRRPFSSEKAIVGGIKLIVYAALVAMAVQLDVLLSLDMIRRTLILYFGLSLGSSILENAGLAGIRVPNIISEIIDRALAKIKNGGEK